MIHRLVDDMGNWRCNDDVVENIVTSFDQILFTSTNPSHDVVEQVANSITNRLSPVEVDFLNLPFIEHEVKEALSSLGPLKAPEPDGIHTFFFQRH